MREAAADLEFETAARLRDEIKRLQETELALADDPLARQSAVEERSGGFRGDKKYGASANLPNASKVRKNTLDEMTVGRTEVPLSKGALPKKPGSSPEDDVKPVVRGKIGAGSYEDPAEERQSRGRPKKSGRPGR